MLIVKREHNGVDTITDDGDNAGANDNADRADDDGDREYDPRADDYDGHGAGANNEQHDDCNHDGNGADDKSCG